jgi:hypothetical protein
MSQGGWQRVNPIGDGFIRAPARLLVEPVTAIYPANINAIVNLASGGYTTEVQTLSETGGPTGGTFTLSFLSIATSAIVYNATAAQVQTALVALPGIGTGGVVCSGGPLPGSNVTITFAGALANLAQPLIGVPSSLQALTPGGAAAVITRTTPGFGLYDPVGNWTDLGSTKTGIHVDRNNTETLIDVDQILTALTALPDNWEMTVTTAFAETTLENIQLAWEGGTITTDATQTPNERHLGMGAPLFYTSSNKRLAVLVQKTVGPSANRIKAIVFRNVTRSPQASRLTFDKTGPQQTVPMVFRAFADPTIGDPGYRFGEQIEQLFA